MDAGIGLMWLVSLVVLYVCVDTVCDAWKKINGITDDDDGEYESE